MALTPKQRYAEAVINLAQDLAAISDRLEPLESEYFDNGYNSGGADELVDNDVTENKTTAAEIADAITLVQELTKFLNAGSPANGDYSVTMNKMRRAGRR